MRIALCVFPLHYEMSAALAAFKASVREASEAGAELIVLPETCLLGLEISGRVEEDWQLCLQKDSEEFQSILDCAREHRIKICFGFLEYEQGCIFDSAAFISSEGKLLEVYRRISIGWMIPGVDEEHYLRGKVLPTIEIDGLKLGLLICGDLCEEELIAELESRKLDLCLHLMARSFEISDEIQSLWDRDELPFYSEEWKRLARYTLCVNSLSPDLFRDETEYCGGAWVVDKSAKLLASKSLLEQGMLIWDLPLNRI